MSNGGGLPNDIISAIAISNAKSIGEQPAILSNLALANQIANANMAQQNLINNQQAMFQLQMTTVAKCVEMIASINPNNSNAAEQMQTYQKMMEIFVQQFGKLTTLPTETANNQSK